MEYQDIQLQVDGPLASLSLNRPEKGNGPVFSAGHDFSELVGGDVQDYRAIFATCTKMMLLLREIPQPVIAGVHGVATAAGCQLVVACDLAVAAEDARFATPGVKIGLFCTTPMVPLSRVVGRKKALEMLFTGEFISAMQSGLVNRVVPVLEVEDAVRKLADHICQFSRTVLGTGKKAFYQQIEMAEQLAYAYASEVVSIDGVMPVAKEGMTAFFEKRTPVWHEWVNRQILLFT